MSKLNPSFLARNGTLECLRVSLQIIFRQSAHFGDGWMSVCLVAGAFLSISAIVPFSARVLFILNYDKGKVIQSKIP